MKIHRDRPSDDAKAVSPPRRFAVARRRAPATSERSCGQTSPPFALLLAGALLRAILAIAGSESGPFEEWRE